MLEVEDGYDKNMLQYTTLPLGIVIMKGYVVTISLYENLNIDDMAQGRIKGVNTDLKTRFLLLLLLRISQRYLIYLAKLIGSLLELNKDYTNQCKIKN